MTFEESDTSEVSFLDEVMSDVLRKEADAILSVIPKTSKSLAAAAMMLFESKGPIIVAGVGKSGQIAKKVASTFRSLGIKAAFLHAAEASHGDLGIIHDDSVVLVLSNSGETTELSDLLFYCREYSIPVVSITASEQSTLGKNSRLVIAHGPLVEACVNGLAPTTSTTVALALGDALAVGVSQLSDVQAKDFRRYHPGGRLGVRLLRVADLMHSGDALPIVDGMMPMQEVVIEMSRKGFGVAIVCKGEVAVGVITDGDMRRNVDRLWQSTAADIMLGRPKSVSQDLLATDCLREMNQESITCIIVNDADSRLVGLIHIHDLLRAGIDQ